MTSFLVLYRGETVAAAQIMAVSADSSLVGEFAERLLSKPEELKADAALVEMERGRRKALRVVADEADG